jgi:hypothetical protein
MATAAKAVPRIPPILPITIFQLLESEKIFSETSDVVWVIVTSRRLVWIGDTVPDECVRDEGLVVDGKPARLDKDS